jgi:hypothetical protein
MAMIEEKEQVTIKPLSQALWFVLHSILALAVWFGMMMAGYALNPPGVSQTLILIVSIFVPLVVGHFIARFHPDEVGPSVWLLGLIWMLIVSIWVLDLPTGPNHCFDCDATEKLTRTFFSYPKPGGLIDDDGPFLATWPAAALLGYSIGAWLAVRHAKSRQ